MNLIDRILARFGYWRWPTRNGHRDVDAMVRGARWQNFYGEPDGLSDAISALRRGYFEKVAQVQPGDIDALLALSLADRILGEIDGVFKQIIVEGEIAKNAKEHADRIAALPEPMRRRL